LKKNEDTITAQLVCEIQMMHMYFQNQAVT